MYIQVTEKGFILHSSHMAQIQNLSYVFYPFLLKHPSPVSRLRFYHVVLISQEDWEKGAIFKTWSGLCVVFLCYPLHSYSASPYPGA